LPATLTVTRDTNPPILLQAYNVGLTNITILFSKQVNPATATDLSNYSISPTLAIGAAVMAEGQSVTLDVSTMVLGTNYVITVNGVQDVASSPNVIAPNSQIEFMAGTLVPGTIGQPSPGGATTVVAGGINLTAGGSIGGSADAAPFEYILQSGNFDFSVRVKNLTLSSPWAEAGLMARMSLDPAGTFAGVFATPSIANCFFDSRTVEGGTDSSSGVFPVNYPNTWLRLKRLGTQFTGYAGFDGSNWVQLGTVSLPGNPVYLGLVAASQNTNQTTVAEFQDFGTALSVTIGNFTPPGEPLGPSSRHTQFVFSEIMYTPAARTDGLNTEYLEIYNSNPWWDDLGGYQLAGQVQYTFPSPTIVPGGGFLVVAAAPGDVQSVYGITNVVGPYTGSLKKGGELQLISAVQGILLEVLAGGLAWPDVFRPNAETAPPEAAWETAW